MITSVLVPGVAWPRYQAVSQAQSCEEKKELAKAYRAARAGKPRATAAVCSQTAKILGWVAAHPGHTGSEIAEGMGIPCNHVNKALGYAAEGEKLRYEWVTANSGRPAKIFFTWDIEYI